MWISPAHGQESLGKAEPLVGIGSLHVLVENVSISPRKDGVTKDLLRGTAELGLLRNNVSITAKRRPPYLYVALHTVPDATYAFAVNIEVLQETRILVNGTIWLAATWQKELIATVGRSRLPDAVKMLVLRALDEFSHAYLLANPPGQKNQPSELERLGLVPGD